MNALTVSWKLKADLLAILAAASRSQEEHASESRLLSATKVRRHRGSSSVTKLTPQTESDELVVEDEAQGSGVAVRDLGSG